MVFSSSSSKVEIVELCKHSLQEAARDVEQGVDDNHRRLDADKDNQSNDDKADEEDEKSNSFLSSGMFEQWRSTGVIIALILFLGVASSAAFLVVGISSSRTEQENQFQRGATDLVKKIESQFAQYENAASMVHNNCRSRNFTRTDFRELYEYLIAQGLEFKGVQFDPNVTRAERPAMEAEARAYYALNYPDVNYRGFVGFETEIPSGLEPRSEQDFYFPIHYMEPIPGNVGAIDLDYYSHISRRQTLKSCFKTGQPALTDRLVLVKTDDEDTRCGAGGDASYGVVLMHPGVNLTTQRDVWPRDLSSIVICMPSLLASSIEGQGIRSDVYIFDASDSSGQTVFLGGARADGDTTDLEFLPETELEGLQGTRLFFSEDVSVTNKRWTVAVVALDGTYEPTLAFVILGAVITLIASCCLALWVFHSTRRMTKFGEMKAEAEHEKASLILENARQATKAQRELNDYIGHEVRNPVSAAMAACSFVKTAVSKPEPLTDEESRKTVREDVEIIDNSLRFVNDLLRNMLDMHRAANNQLQVNMAPTDLLHDVLEPVGGMLYQRNGDVKVIVDCPPNLYIITDSLRLKQVILNLGRNSSKFISKGFIRLRAAEINGLVQLSVEDSGSGIPTEKRALLFAKFQESLDVLSQGTGIGLFLCKSLTELMGGEIHLDDDYDSGIPGCPGTRFVINMEVPPLDPPLDEFSSNSLSNLDCSGGSGAAARTKKEGASIATDLPEKLSVLFVDDDRILRKLFSRSIRTIAPGWTFREAANGETALRLVEADEFDLIFMDMYMASVEKQLLGTETVAALRSRGVTSRICGLSANDVGREFMEAGADAFMIKPFPYKGEELKIALLGILYGKGKGNPL